jgi:hypothetical protein
MFDKEAYNQGKKRIEPTIILWTKRLYVVAGNIYAWFWLIREIFFRQQATFEDYLLWFFLTISFYWFTSDHPEIFFRDKNNKII